MPEPPRLRADFRHEPGAWATHPVARTRALIRALTGAGAILPRPALENEVKAGTLVARNFAASSFSRPIGIIYRRGRELSLAARTFLTLLKHDLGADAAGADTGLP